MRYALAFTLGLLPAPVFAQSDCGPAPAPVLNLAFDSRYAEDDPDRATLDEAREAAAKAALDPLDDFVQDLANGLEAALSDEDPAQRADLAACLLSRMGDWARADALAQLGTTTVELTIGSRLAAFAIMAGQAASLAPSSADLDDIRAWLVRRMDEQMNFWETAPDRASQNNLRAWAALAGAATAGLVDDPVMRGWAAWSIAYVICSVDEDGSLPQEMRRGKYALHYQLHALAPLTTAAVLLRAQGIDLADRCDGALGRSVRFALSDLEDGQRTQGITGEVQSYFDGSDTLETWQLAWLESYLVLDPDPAIDTFVNPLRPLSYSKLGGNQTLIFGHGR
ncbi:MAG: hypothetical protein CML68_02125 [Rhodobacteraceae bacterium]|nr:hypothetical protein [Paracoccaceae bacterium]